VYTRRFGAFLGMPEASAASPKSANLGSHPDGRTKPSRSLSFSVTLTSLGAVVTWVSTPRAILRNREFAVLPHRSHHHLGPGEGGARVRHGCSAQ
jgi:hypothetical protein